MFVIIDTIYGTRGGDEISRVVGPFFNEALAIHGALELAKNMILEIEGSELSYMEGAQKEEHQKWVEKILSEVEWDANWGVVQFVYAEERGLTVHKLEKDEELHYGTGE